MTEKRCSTCKHRALDVESYPCIDCESILSHTRWEPADPFPEEVDAGQDAYIAALEKSLGDVVFCYLHEAAQGDGVNDVHYDVIMNAKALLGHAAHESALLAQAIEAFEEAHAETETP